MIKILFSTDNVKKRERKIDSDRSAGFKFPMY